MVTGIIFLAILGWAIWSNRSDLVEVAIAVGLTLFAGVFLLGIASIPAEKPDGVYNVGIVQLKSREDVGSSGGGSFLGWHISEGIPQYVVMHSVNDRMIRKFLPQNKTYIAEVSTEPMVVYNSFVNYCPRWRSLPFFWRYRHDFYKTDYATIYVPVGTVIKKYSPIN